MRCHHWHTHGNAYEAVAIDLLALLRRCVVVQDADFSKLLVELLNRGGITAEKNRLIGQACTGFQCLLYQALEQAW